MRHRVSNMWLTSSYKSHLENHREVFLSCPTPESPSRTSRQQPRVLPGPLRLLRHPLLSLPATPAPATLDFGNSLPPSGLLELLGRAGAGWAQWEGGGQTPRMGAQPVGMCYDCQATGMDVWEGTEAREMQRKPKSRSRAGKKETGREKDRKQSKMT